MEPGAVVLIVTIGVIMVLFSVLRGRGGVRHRPEVVQFILFDIKIDQVLVETFYQREKIRRLEKNNWEINKGKLDFLGEELNRKLCETFALVEDVNAQLKQARKNKTTHHDIDVSGLVGPLAECRKGLEDWMMDNLGTLEPPIRYPSLTGFLFGER